ncbi:MAG TPA: maleylpyruvate isomerase N-terminal domain-containing protein [Streptosporangiales bacterium]
MTVSDEDAGASARLLRDQYRAITDLVGGVDEPVLLGPTRCAGWTVLDLLFHVLLDAQRALMTFATPSDGEPDRDLVSYWSEFGPDQSAADQLDHALFVRRAAAAYARPATLVRHWQDTSAAAARAAAACPHERVATQGHVLTVPDFVATLVTEAAVHQLDLAVGLPGTPPPAGALAVVRRTLDGLLGSPPPEHWDDLDYILKGTGRVPLDAADRTALGEAAGRFPLFG